MNLQQFAPRACPVCQATAGQAVYRQEFTQYSEGTLMQGFDLTICSVCGAAYADRIPSQTEFDRYYKEMSKYEYSDRNGVQTETDITRFKEIAALLEPSLKTDDAILDIGCATGGLLAEFKRRGYHHVAGVDPSPQCVARMRQLYDIHGEVKVIGELAAEAPVANMAILIGVLEHIRDVDMAVKAVKACLKPLGGLYVEVPDATRYDRHFSAPYQFFSMEHVNYFSPASLRNLMARHGLVEQFSNRLIRRLSPQAIEPAVGALFRLEDKSTSLWVPSPDMETAPALDRYLEKSRALDKAICRKIDTLVESRRPIAVWGVGTHTLRLLKTSRLKDANIAAFIDSNPHYQGKTLSGIAIIKATTALAPNVEILISSQTAEDEILENARRIHGSTRIIHRLYSDIAHGSV